VRICLVNQSKLADREVQAAIRDKDRFSDGVMLGALGTMSFMLPFLVAPLLGCDMATHTVRQRTPEQRRGDECAEAERALRKRIEKDRAEAEETMAWKYAPGEVWQHKLNDNKIMLMDTIRDWSPGAEKVAPAYRFYVSRDGNSGHGRISECELETIYRQIEKAGKDPRECADDE